MSNLTQRILVAVVAIPLFVFLSIRGGVPFFALVALISTLGLYEFYKLAEKKAASPQILLGLLFGFCVVFAFIAERFPGLKQKLGTHELFVMFFTIFVPMIFLVELFRRRENPLLNVATTVGGVCYVSLFLGALVGVRELFVPTTKCFESAAGFDDRVELIYHWGGITIITMFTSIWMCDSLAYIVGRTFGRHKLFERISPKKTWEGAIAGYIGAVVTFIIAQKYFLPYMSLRSAFVCGSIVGVFGQLGDLVESLLKRDAGVKDSSALIPGHGGALDRFDSLIVVSPLVHLYLRFILS